MALRILIVEDEPLIAMDLQSILEDAGHTIVGREVSMAGALQVAATVADLELAIMDVDLVLGPDGVETARNLRERYDVASLFVSARLTDDVLTRAAAWRPVDFIGKPYQERQILAAIERFAAADRLPLSLSGQL